MGALYRIVSRFGDRIRSLRKKRNLTQEQLAERSGLHVTYISLIEHGKYNASLKTISRLAHGLRIPVWEMFLGIERRRDLPGIEYLQEIDLIKKTPGRPSHKASSKHNK